jgi:hypothetical protein
MLAIGFSIIYGAPKPYFPSVSHSCDGSIHALMHVPLYFAVCDDTIVSMVDIRNIGADI